MNAEATDRPTIAEELAEVDDPVGPVTLPGRLRAGARTYALAGAVLGISAFGAVTVLPPFTTISLHGPAA